MRINKIQLAWFRGAAKSASLDLNCKSIVVYGSNGAGKSSFVDAVEHALNDGKIGHLTHEYSGRRQERGILNTHIPDEENAWYCIEFEDGTKLVNEINHDGVQKRSGNGIDAMCAWDYRRIILRQDEVSEFIHGTKGAKYSALLPLLGLHRLEVAADNLRQLSKTVQEKARVEASENKLIQIEHKRKEVFGTDNADHDCSTIQQILNKYRPDDSATEDIALRLKNVLKVIDERIDNSSAEQRRIYILKEMADLKLKDRVSDVRKASGKLADVIDPLIKEKLQILQLTDTFVDNIVDAEEVNCPACGRLISVSDFMSHVKTESKRIEELTCIFSERKIFIDSMCDAVKILKDSINKNDILSWREEFAQRTRDDSLVFLDELDINAIRTTCTEGTLEDIEKKLIPIVNAAARSVKDVPPDAKQLTVDKTKAEVGKNTIEAIDESKILMRNKALIYFINLLAKGVRDEIRKQSEKVINDISEDMQKIWAILHPDKKIDKIRLCQPDDSDKAIDIGLMFHGVVQQSPRLTLSEGYRNSLGLCIFMAMANREKNKTQPLILDDVVISLDRNHRGMVADILTTLFHERQVIILTHDRAWYTELRHQLDGREWLFKTLMPYDTPENGIRLSEKTTTFSDARAQLMERPDAAGNDARKIMDIELALIAERLCIRLPFKRGDKNDMRMANEFNERLSADSPKCFQLRKANGEYDIYESAIDKLKLSGRLLASLANRASHSFDLELTEAKKLIDACEEAIESFKCPSCNKWVWYTRSDSAKLVQCQCGNIRWHCGKV